ncbi:hypothetical protein GGS23DRAFT_589218 [Durotheca rogersii]|uniref:uncharacterized protein n=1 Tax=Durotheca rogersii TaxID=419775 RepID=UPI00221F7F0C|nr:uncharacterized protein GGS23DRAFT_589218 [Durotheca rogersii]KAI5856212.1 hypothetical protein GGS23DRAFT_589218 [Durotheca rogersii]
MSIYLFLACLHRRYRRRFLGFPSLKRQRNSLSTLLCAGSVWEEGQRDKETRRHEERQRANASGVSSHATTCCLPIFIASSPPHWSRSDLLRPSQRGWRCKTLAMARSTHTSPSNLSTIKSTPLSVTHPSTCLAIHAGPANSGCPASPGYGK